MFAALRGCEKSAWNGPGKKIPGHNCLGPVPDSSEIVRYLVVSSGLFQKQHGRAFQQSADLLNELCCVHTIDHPMVK